MGVNNLKFVLIVECNRSIVLEALKKCLCRKWGGGGRNFGIFLETLEDYLL